MGKSIKIFAIKFRIGNNGNEIIKFCIVLLWENSFNAIAVTVAYPFSSHRLNGFSCLHLVIIIFRMATAHQYDFLIIKSVRIFLNNSSYEIISWNKIHNFKGSGESPFLVNWRISFRFKNSSYYSRTCAIVIETNRFEIISFDVWNFVYNLKMSNWLNPIYFIKRYAKRRILHMHDLNSFK